MPTDTAAPAVQWIRGEGTALQERVHRIGERDEAARDRRGARSAIRLQHIAIDRDGALARPFRSTTARSARPISR